MYMSALSVCMPVCRKRASDPYIYYDPPCGCWKLNSGPLEKYMLLLTGEPSFQPQIKYFLSKTIRKMANGQRRHLITPLISHSRCDGRENPHLTIILNVIVTFGEKIIGQKENIYNIKENQVQLQT